MLFDKYISNEMKIYIAILSEHYGYILEHPIVIMIPMTYILHCYICFTDGSISIIKIHYFYH